MPVPRRIAALVLPRLLCELAAAQEPAPPRGKRPPLAVVLLAPDLASASIDQRLAPQSRIDAVDETARRLGLREGLTLAEAHAFVSSLAVRIVTHPQAHDALARCAEIALAFAPTVALSPPDALHVDLTGASHLAGGEQSVCEELASRIGRLGHFVRVALASGPRIAEAIARHGPLAVAVVPPGYEASYLRELPVLALPMDEEVGCWLVRLGVVTIGDLVRLPREQLASRLGDRAPEILALIDGNDAAPLHAYEPPDLLREGLTWDDGIEQQASLAFVLKRLVTNLSARLEGRALATNAIELVVQLDRSIARLRGVDAQLSFRVDLPAPLYRVDDLMRTLRTRLERCELAAPAVGIVLQAPATVRAPRIQLDLSRDVTASPDALPVLLAELSAEIGAERVGTLRLQDNHRPESRSTLVPVTSTAPRAPADPQPLVTGLGSSITRLLPSPVHLGRSLPAIGQVLLGLPGATFEIERVVFDARLDGVEWWTPSPVHRDYLHVWLRAGAATWGASAWFYLDRHTRHLVLQGWQD